MTNPIEPVKPAGTQLEQHVPAKREPMVLQKMPDEQMVFAPGMALIEKKLIYLASPYSSPDSHIRGLRYVRACKAAAVLMGQDHIVFSPIAHTHGIAMYGGIHTGWDFWEKYDRAILECCKELWVLDIPGWTESKGILAEIKIARELGIPVRLVSESGELIKLYENMEDNFKA